ncbi:diphosphomevalonate decarboxylase [Nocardia arizonensis]|uniref:diphosphomevalonate decarboxylase n=1 Tax=Nocardia arizonensis TaxID=1141647 RepID=UPI000A613F8C|nr:diphosphomevalonate decarboxylase [Nocardia arizonensis]
MTSPSTWSQATAYPNIALVKYWGKRDPANGLATTDSLSLTVGIHPAVTRVRILSDGSDADVVRVNGERAPDAFASRVRDFLDIVRARGGRSERCEVDTVNGGPIGAGLASSASGFAALAGASSMAYGLATDPRSLSLLARRGSGSACRSIYGGFSTWRVGTASNSAGEPVSSPLTDDVAMVVVTVSAKAKEIGSSEGMRLTTETSPFYDAWVASSVRDFATSLDALEAGDIHALGAVAEANAFRMHAVMLSAQPPIRYLTDDTFAVISAVRKARAAGLAAYATMDAGPNVKVLTCAGDVEDVARALKGAVAGIDVQTCFAGPAIAVQEDGDVY